MKMKQTLWVSIACLLYVGAGQAQAASISIFNTGVDGMGVSLPDGTIGDPHYTLLSVPGGTTDIRIRDSSGLFPVDSHYTGAGDSVISRWIGPNNDSILTGPPSGFPVVPYIYRTTFDLTGFDPTTAMVAGKWITDNDGLDIRINGNSLGNTTTFTSYSDNFSLFSIGSGFIGGINTLDFWVNNGGSSDNATALRVEITSATASVVPVPEPASLLLIGSGLVVLAAWRRKYAA